MGNLNKQWALTQFVNDELSNVDKILLMWLADLAPDTSCSAKVNVSRLADSLGVSRQYCGTALKRLASLDMVTLRSGRGRDYTTFTILRPRDFDPQTASARARAGIPWFHLDTHEVVEYLEDTIKLVEKVHRDRWLKEREREDNERRERLQREYDDLTK